MPTASIGDGAAAGRGRQLEIDQKTKKRNASAAHSGVLRICGNYFRRARHARGRERLRDETSSQRRAAYCYSRDYEGRHLREPRGSAERVPEIASPGRKIIPCQDQLLGLKNCPIVRCTFSSCSARVLATARSRH